jgi:hypothetical protein
MQLFLYKLYKEENHSRRIQPANEKPRARTHAQLTLTPTARAF